MPDTDSRQEDAQHLAQHKEYASLRWNPSDVSALPIGFSDYENIRMTERASMNLQGHQIFLRNLLDPHTRYKRLLINHATGTGKTMIMNSVARIYIDHFKLMKEPVQVTVIGFTEDVVIRELMTYPEFGYITRSEVEEMARLNRSTNEREIQIRNSKKAAIKKRITNPSRGGFYKFYGYQKFAHDILIITPQGEHKGVLHTWIYEDESKFEDRLKSSMEKGDIELNMPMIEAMRNGLVMCDEIHNTYNMRAKNNRGMAIKFILDMLERENPATAPRALFVTATPLTGSPTEIIDVMNLLIPLASYRREEFFQGEELKPDALERIGRICSGYVSFLGDTQSAAYPSRSFAGDELEGVPYLRFVKCKMSPYHERVLAEAMNEGTLGTNAHALVDIVFPHPDCPPDGMASCSKGLYITGEVRQVIDVAPPAWRSRVGIGVTSDALTGSFLRVDNVGTYSTKYQRLMKDIVALIKGRTIGKILVYHYYVVTSGVLLLRELLYQNGFIGPYTNPSSATMCSICGITKGEHRDDQDHGYMPCRVLTMYGEEKKEMDRNLTLFRDSANVNGYEYRVVIGSQAIQEGLNFNAVRFLFVVHPPRDISSLIQLLGRAIRRGSHQQLPRDMRTVEIRIYIHTSAKIETPDVLHYRRKMKSYLGIQLIERELRRYAVDCFINYEKMRKDTVPTIDGLPFEPYVSAASASTASVPAASYTASWKAFGFADEEVRTITGIIKILFSYRPVWLYDDLWSAVRTPSRQYKTSYDHSSFEERSFVIALNFLIGHSYIKHTEDTFRHNAYIPTITIAEEQRRIVYCPPFFMLVPIDEIGAPSLDYDIFMRDNALERYENVDLHIEDQDMSSEEFDLMMGTVRKNYRPEEMIYCVSEISMYFHIYAMRRIVEGSGGWESLAHLHQAYKEMGILLYPKDLLNKELAQTYGATDTSTPIGFRMREDVAIYNRRNQRWSQAPALLVYKDSRKENSIVIGYIDLKNFEPVFRLRKPYHLSEEGIEDRRKISRGVVCSTLLRDTKLAYISELGISIQSKKNDDALCRAILRGLIDRDMEERRSEGTLRWFYNIFEEA